MGYIFINEKKGGIGREGSTQSLTAALQPETATEKILWHSDNKKIAKAAQDGTITAGQEGETTVRALTYSGKEATCTVKVGGGSGQDPGNNGDNNNGGNNDNNNNGNNNGGSTEPTAKPSQAPSAEPSTAPTKAPGARSLCAPI